MKPLPSTSTSALDLNAIVSVEVLEHFSIDEKGGGVDRKSPNTRDKGSPIQHGQSFLLDSLREAVHDPAVLPVHVSLQPALDDVKRHDAEPRDGAGQPAADDVSHDAVGVGPASGLQGGGDGLVADEVETEGRDVP